MADDDNNKRPIIIKKIIKVEGGGHHGGAWKVAYADFTTAMMAFFMLLWLLNVAPPETLAGLADYFSPTSSSTIGSPNEATNRIADPGQNPSPIVTISTPGAPPSGETNDGDEKGGEGQEEVIDPSENEDQSFEQMQDQLRLAIQQSPALQDLSENLIMEITEEGMKIQLIDKDRRAMFRQGSDELYNYAIEMLNEIGRSVQTLPNRITVQGHTDGGSFTGKDGDSNWELSADRANSARRVLGTSGVTDDRIFEVIGKAGTDPLYPDQPTKTENRRITVLVLREAPVVPGNLLGGN